MPAHAPYINPTPKVYCFEQKEKNHTQINENDAQIGEKLSKSKMHMHQLCLHEN